jgi:hypothetical protein
MNKGNKKTKESLLVVSAAWFMIICGGKFPKKAWWEQSTKRQAE